MKNDTKIVGFNIYKNDKNQNIYYNRFNKKGYLIDDKHINEFNLYNKRYFLAIAGAILLSSFTNKVILSIFVAIILIIFTEFWFYRNFLPKLTQFENFKTNIRINIISQIKDSHSKGKLLLKTFLFIAFGVLLYLHSQEKQLMGANLYLVYVVSFLSICLGFLHLFLYFNKSKDNNN